MKIREVPAETIEKRVQHVIDKIDEGTRDPYVRQRTARLVQDLKPKDWTAELQAVWNHVKDHVRYTLDTAGHDLFQRARRTFQLGIGDCDDMAIVLGSMLKSIGHPVALKIVDTDGEGWNHIYLLTGVPPDNPKKWLPMDLAALNKPMGWEVKRTKRSRVFRI